MDLLTIALGIISVIGTVATIYFGIKSFKLERARNSFTWNDVESGALDILKRAERDFKPDILLMLSGPGGIVTSLAMVKSGRFYPVYTAMLENRKRTSFSFKPKGYTEISTKKWNIYMPDILSDESDRCILVIDDCVMSGDVLTAVRDSLEKKGFSEKNIVFSTLVCSKIARQANKAPDIYRHLNPHGEFYFPWGEWY